MSSDQRVKNSITATHSKALTKETIFSAASSGNRRGYTWALEDILSTFIMYAQGNAEIWFQMEVIEIGKLFSPINQNTYRRCSFV